MWSPGAQAVLGTERGSPMCTDEPPKPPGCRDQSREHTQAALRHELWGLPPSTHRSGVPSRSPWLCSVTYSAAFCLLSSKSS